MQFKLNFGLNKRRQASLFFERIESSNAEAKLSIYLFKMQ